MCVSCNSVNLNLYLLSPPTGTTTWRFTTAGTSFHPCWESFAGRSHRLRSSPAAASSSSSSSPTTRHTGRDSLSATRSSRQVRGGQPLKCPCCRCLCWTAASAKSLNYRAEAELQLLCCFLHAPLNVMNRLMENSQFKFNCSLARFPQVCSVGFGSMSCITLLHEMKNNQH